MEASCSVHWPSSSSSRRFVEFNLKWNWHFGQTFQLASRSFFQTMARQASHLIHSPSVLTRRSSGGVSCSTGFFSRLNQAIREVHSRQFTVDSKSAPGTVCHPERRVESDRPAVTDRSAAATSVHPSAATPHPQRTRVRDDTESALQISNQCPAAPVYPWYRGVSPRASRSRDRPTPPAWDGRSARCR